MGQIGWLMLDRVVRLVAGVVVTAAVARYLGPSSFGVLASALALVGLMMFLPVLGLDELVRRDLVQAPDQTDNLLGTIARLRGVVGLGVWGALVLFVVGAGVGSSEERTLWIVIGLTLFQPLLWLPELYFQATRRARQVATAQLVGVIGGAVARLLLILGGSDLVWFGVVVVGEMLVVAGMLRIALRRAGVGTGWWGAWNRSRASALLAQSWPLLLAGAAVTLYMRIDQVMLRHLAGEREAGIYAVAVRLSEAVYFVPGALVTGLLPLWIKRRAEGGARHEQFVQGLYDLQVALAAAFAGGVSWLAPWIITMLFGSEYRAAATVLTIHVWAGLFVFMGVTRSQEWVLENRGRLILGMTVLGGAVNIGLNFWLIPRHGAGGAAIATLVSYGVAAWLGSFVWRETRLVAWRQTKALLLPLLGWRYLWRR